MGKVQDYLKEIGKRGGEKTKEKYGKDYFKKLAQKSAEARKKKKETKEKQG